MLYFSIFPGHDRAISANQTFAVEYTRKTVANLPEPATGSIFPERVT